MSPAKNPVDDEQGHEQGQSAQPVTLNVPHHPPPPVFSGSKRARENEPGPAEFYKLPGMGDLTERELRQNELLSKRYQKKE